MLIDDKVQGPIGCSDEYDLPKALDLANKVIRIEIKNAPPTIGHDFPYIYCHSNRENVRIIKVGEQVISTVGIFISNVKMGDRIIKIGGINCLATERDYRKHGYGSIIMMDAVKRMEELGCHISMLGTTITEYYRTLGWEYGGLVYTYNFDSGNIDFLDQVGYKDDYQTEWFSESNIKEVLDLYHSWNLGSQRTIEMGRLI